MNRSTAAKTGRGRRLIHATGLGALVAVLALTGAPGAFAANDDYLEISLDGVTYSAAVPGPIFSDAVVYVPGATTSASIWVRNNGADPAWLSAAAVMVRSDPQLDGYVGLAAASESGLFTRTALGPQGTCTDIKQVWNLAPGEAMDVGLVADLSLAAPSDTMNRTADFDVRFLLESQDAAPRPACDAGLAGPSQPGEPVKVPGDSGAREPDRSAAEVVTLSGTASPSGPAADGVWTAGMPGNAPVEPSKEATPGEQQPQAGIVPAGIHSTVEPIIRSLSGTLLIAMSVVFSAAVILRLRNRREIE